MANPSHDNNDPEPKSNLWQVAVSTAHKKVSADLRELGRYCTLSLNGPGSSRGGTKETMEDSDENG